MGTFSKGILGGFNGTVGTVIGGSWKGIDYMRSRPSRKANNPTQRQLEQQKKFAVVIFFLETMVGLIRITYKNFANRMTAFNAAMGYHVKYAVVGTYPDYEIDFSLVQASKGSLPNAIAPAAAVSGNNINFTWTDNSGVGIALATDLAILVAYCADTRQTIYTTDGGTRSGGAGSLNVTSMAGYQVQTYIAFISEEGNEVATSIYTGALTV
jgi:hypothetical protein